MDQTGRIHPLPPCATVHSLTTMSLALWSIIPSPVWVLGLETIQIWEYLDSLWSHMDELSFDASTFFSMDIHCIPAAEPCYFYISRLYPLMLLFYSLVRLQSIKHTLEISVPSLALQLVNNPLTPDFGLKEKNLCRF